MQLQAMVGSLSPKGGCIFKLNGCGLHMYHSVTQKGFLRINPPPPPLPGGWVQGESVDIRIDGWVGASMDGWVGAPMGGWVGAPMGGWVGASMGG